MDSSGLASFALTMKSGKATANVHALYEEMKIFDSTDMLIHISLLVVQCKIIT